MAALATVAKKVWSARRLLVLLFTPLVLLPVVFALPPKVTPPLLGGPPIPPALGGRASQDPVLPSLPSLRDGIPQRSQSRFHQTPPPPNPLRSLDFLALRCCGHNSPFPAAVAPGSPGPSSLLDPVISAGMILFIGL